MSLQVHRARLLRTAEGRRGYTLIEMMVAIGLLAFFGSGLVVLLRQSTSLWRSAETRGQAYEQARSLLDLIASDLRSAVVRGGDAYDDSWVRFVLDNGVNGQTRLRFVRAIDAELSQPGLRYAGEMVSTRAAETFRGYVRKLPKEHEKASRLRSPSGLMEVCYLTDPRSDVHALWRGVRAPIGGRDSFFFDANIESPSTNRSELRRRGTSRDVTSDTSSGAPESSAVNRTASPSGAQDESVDPDLSSFAAAIAEHVLYLGFRCGNSTTTGWHDAPTNSPPTAPSAVWNAHAKTRARTRGATDRRSESEESAPQHRFPQVVEVTVVIGEPEQTLGPRLAKALSTTDVEIELTRPLQRSDDRGDPFVRIGSEWIAVEEFRGSRLLIASGGRGARKTDATDHPRGASVHAGRRFRRFVSIPAAKGRSVAEGEATRPTSGRNR